MILATADTSVNKQEEPCSHVFAFLLCGTEMNNIHFESILLGSKSQEESEYLWLASGVRRYTTGGLLAAEWSDC